MAVAGSHRQGAVCGRGRGPAGADPQCAAGPQPPCLSYLKTVSTSRAETRVSSDSEYPTV